MSLVSFSFNSIDSAHSSASKQDRFIPSRGEIQDFASIYKSAPKRSSVEMSEEPNDENRTYSQLLQTHLPLPNSLKKAPLASTPDLPQPLLHPSRMIAPAPTPSDPPRRIPRSPFKVLDAPHLQDDFYLNVVDWSSSNVLAVGLGSAVYTWNFHTNKVEKVMNFDENVLVSGVTWDQKSDWLALGAINGTVQVFDLNKSKVAQDVAGHNERVGALSFQGKLLLTGSRDKNVLLHDLRTKSPQMIFAGHKQEVCGLRWAPDGQYFASGGNDNKLFVFSPKMQIPLMKKNHKAAVKAIAWSERNNGLLATGAGTADRCIRLWNINDKKMVDFKDTGSQICNIAFSKVEDELITTHGFSNNEICVWKIKNLKKIASMSGHTSRVLYLAMDPKGEHIVTGAGDETLRFWNLGYVNGGVQTSNSAFDIAMTLR